MEEKDKPIFEHDERVVSVSTNLSRDALKGARKKLREGVDWVHQSGLVKYSATGLTSLLQALGIKEPSVDADPKKDAPPAPSAAVGPLKAKVLKLYPNPRIVDAMLGEKKIRVRVRDSSKMTVRMEIPVRLCADKSGLYELTRKTPRWRGRW